MADSAPEAIAEQSEADRQEAERLMSELGAVVAKMRNASPGDAEKVHALLKEACADKRLPGDFTKKILDQARAFECDANMRATDQALQDAINLAHAEKMQERAATLSRAREYYGKARALGANEQFLKAALRRIDTAMMTGGVYKPGAATKAKPADPAPKKPDEPKA